MDKSNPLVDFEKTIHQLQVVKLWMQTNLNNNKNSNNTFKNIKH